MNEQQAAKEAEGSRRRYEKPSLEVLGRVEDFTRVGNTNPGPDTYPGDAGDHHDGGSICPSSGKFC